MALTIRFRGSDSLGAADAADDHYFLSRSFVDTGHLKTLTDCDNPKRIILGRTGAGKTALLSRLCSDCDHVIEVKPESLALSYVSNSTILQFLQDLGVNLDVFFRLLWRHVFCVEILQYHFKIQDEASRNSLIKWIKQKFYDKQTEQALRYLERWGNSFWETTDSRVKEVTTQFEDTLKSQLGVKLSGLASSLQGQSQISQEEKRDITNRAQSIVNEVQVRELGEIVALVDKVTYDPQKRYYIVIDRLDEDWIEERLRYPLIRALIETASEFRKAKHVKIIMALRYDLKDRVFRKTRGAGFQEEKYESTFLHLIWTEEQLTKLVDTRIDQLFKDRYTTKTITHKDLLPGRIDKQPVLKYILDRTFMRPRDAIAFFNSCIQTAAGKTKLTARIIKEAEGDYSRMRRAALRDEWYADYPNLIDFMMLLKNRPAMFLMKDISDEDCTTSSLELAVKGFERQDELSEIAVALINDVKSTEEFRAVVIKVLYKVGVVGLKLEQHNSVEWSIAAPRSISGPEIEKNTRVEVHKAFWRCLGIRPV